MAVITAQNEANKKEEIPEPPPHAPAHGISQPPTLLAANDIRKTGASRPSSMVMRQPVAPLIAPQPS